MIIKSIRVKNFRSIAEETLPCDELTVLAGPNGSGKSAFLRSLDIFYTASPKVVLEDFYAEDTAQEMVIAVTFTSLTEDEKELFRSYIQGEDLTVERVFSFVDGKISSTYHGSTLQNPEFISVREASSAADKRKAYDALRNQSKYQSLSRWTNQAAALESLREWEAHHPEDCEWGRDDGQFFGFKEVAQGYLGKFTRFLFIPAVRDASEDAAEGKGSVLTEIMDLVVRSVLANKEEIKELRRETQKKYDEILDPDKIAELQGLERRLSGTLQTYVPESRVELKWIGGDTIEVPLPKADIKLVEDGYPAAVERTGHGLQRAFILTMFQHLAVTQRGAEETIEAGSYDESGEEQNGAISTMPHIIIGIEEPELYQHPSRQRRFSKVLMDLTSGSIEGVAERTQVIYTTHSPLFVGLDRFDRVRLLRRVDVEEGKPKVTRVIRTTLGEIADDIWRADGRPAEKYTGDTIYPRLYALMTPWMNEGFFADAIVLVEGEEDRAAILGVAMSMGHDLETVGYAVIPCMGKNNIDRPLAIFRRLSIPTYVIWDGDEGDKEAKPEFNVRLLRLLDQPEEEWPDQVADEFACFKKNLHHTLRNEIGETEFDELLEQCQEEFGIPKRKQALKNSVVIQSLIDKARAEGRTCPALEQIVGKVLAHKPGITEQSLTSDSPVT